MVGFQKMTGDLLEGSSTCFLHVTVFSARGSEVVMGLVSRNLLCGMHSLPMTATDEVCFWGGRAAAFGAYTSRETSSSL